MEHDPADLWHTALRTARAAIASAGHRAGEIAAIGITNQRETTHRLGPRDRRAAPQRHRLAGPAHRRFCARLSEGGHEPLLTERTGLLIDPYFSGTKLNWLLDNVPGARARAERGELAFGTVDSWLIWNLTGGRVHATDATNAARTLLYDIAPRRLGRGDLLHLFDIPVALLPEVRDCAGDFGTTDPAVLGPPSRSAASPATSRPRPSARRASRRGC